MLWLTSNGKYEVLTKHKVSKHWTKHNANIKQHENHEEQNAGNELKEYVEDYCSDCTHIRAVGTVEVR